MVKKTEEPQKVMELGNLSDAQLKAAALLTTTTSNKMVDQTDDLADEDADNDRKRTSALRGEKKDVDFKPVGDKPQAKSLAETSQSTWSFVGRELALVMARTTHIDIKSKDAQMSGGGKYRSQVALLMALWCLLQFTADPVSDSHVYIKVDPEGLRKMGCRDATPALINQLNTKLGYAKHDDFWADLTGKGLRSTLDDSEATYAFRAVATLYTQFKIRVAGWPRSDTIATGKILANEALNLHCDHKALKEVLVPIGGRRGRGDEDEASEYDDDDEEVTKAPPRKQKPRRQKAVGQTQGDFTGSCFNCNKKGHKITDCPSPKKKKK